MIRKLRKKLMLLFLSFTMLIFTAAMLLMMGNTIAEVRNSEAAYVGHMADSLMEQVRGGAQIDEFPLSAYAAKVPCWVSISDGTTTRSSPEDFDVPPDDASASYAQEEIVSSEGEARISTSCSVVGTGRERYYKVHSVFSANKTAVYELTMLYPQSTLWTVIRSYCGWYPLLWLGVFVLMYLTSHVLIGKAVQPVEAAMKGQKEFVASASHELKAPLAVIQANAETLDVESPDTAAGRKQAIILEECGRMSGLIRSMLSLAASDAGSWNMDLRETDVDTLLIETWELFSKTARKRQVRLDLDIEDRYPKLYCDRERMTQVLGILIDNAITYSNRGGSVEMGAKVQAKQMVFYAIDHGCGIADAEKGKVFERFYSGDLSRTDKNHYGLGLSIAQEIVKLHQGSICLRDTPNGGCTFEACLPLGKANG